MNSQEKRVKELVGLVSDKATPENFALLDELIGLLIRTDPVRAEGYIRRAYKIAQSLKTLPELSKSWYAMGVINLIMGRSQDAIPHFRKAIKALEELGDAAKRARARGNLANAYSDLGQLDKAERQYKVLLDEFQALKDHIARAKTFYNLGNILMKSSRFVDALESYHQSLDIYRKNPDPIGQSDTLCMMGAAYARVFDYESNLRCCQQALEIIEQAGSSYHEGSVLCALGNAHLFIKQFDKAREYYQRALDIGKEYGIPQFVGSNLTNLAEVLTSEKRYKEALELAKQALEYDRQTDTLHYLATDHYMLGRINHLLDRWKTAGQYLDKAMEMAEKAGLEEIWICSATLAVFNCAKSRKFARGISLLDKLESALEGDRISELYQTAMEAGAVLYSAKGDFRLSNEYFTKYHDTVKEYITQESQRRVQYLQVAFETERREKERRWLAKQNRLLEKRVREEVAKHREMDRLLAEQENMALLGRITAGMAHELNNPLAAIKQAVEITLKSMDKGKAGKLYLSEKQGDIYKMLNRINRLVEIIKVISHSPDRFSSHLFNVNDVVEEFTDLFADRVMTGDMVLATELSERLPAVYGDAIRFLQVISILVNNACDALRAKKDGKVKKISIRTYAKDGRVCLMITDNGHGMSEELLGKAKQPFFSTKDVDKGMGMGLSIASSIISQMNGELTLQSKLNEGTAVRVCVPAQLDAPGEGK
jgi:signal transduction histidine kinase/uncharacterized protein HemY